MHKFFCLKHVFVAVVLVAFIALTAPCVQASGVEIIPWFGKVVDKDTGEPVEGAVIVREWDRYVLGPVGSARLSETVEEVLSNKKGRFLFHKKKFQVSVPGYWVEEENPLVYKPGYRALFLNDKPLTIYLQRVPTLAATREHETDLNYKGLDIDAAKILTEMLTNEEDFIERNLKNRTVLRNKGRIVNDPNSSNRVGAKFYGGFGSSADFGVGGGTEFGARSGSSSGPSLAALGMAEAKTQAPEELMVVLKKKDCTTKAAALIALQWRTDLPFLKLLIDIYQKDSCEEARRSAAAGLKNNIRRLGVEELMELLQAKDCMMRAAVCAALGKTKDARAPQILMDRLQHDPCGDVKKKAAQGLVDLGTLAYEVIAQAQTGDDQNLHKELAWVVGQRPREKDTKNPLSGLDHPLEESLPADLRSSPPEARIQKLRRLGRWKSSLAAKPILQFLITETDSKVKRAAADALFDIGDPAIVEIAYAAGSGNDQNSKECMQVLDEILDRREENILIARLELSTMGEDSIIEQLANDRSSKKYKWVLQHFRRTLLNRYAGPKDIAALRLSQLGGAGFNVLEEAMCSDYSETRKCAARAMGELKDARFIEPLIAALNDNHPDVQLMAAWALGELNDPHAIVPLVNALGSDVAGRAQVCEVLVAMDIADTTPLIALLKNRDSRGKQGAVWVLGELQDKKAVEQIASLLETSTDPNLQGEAARSLGKIKDKRALPALIRILRSVDDPRMSAAISRALSSINSNTAEPLSALQKQQQLSALIDIAKTTPSFNVKLTAVSALGELHDTRATPVLLHILKTVLPTIAGRSQASFEAKKTLSFAVQALGKIKDPASVDPLIALLSDKDCGQYAAAVLGYIQDPRAVEPLMALLDDSQTGAAAARALASIGDVRAIVPLVEILEQDNHANRYSAAFALGSFNDFQAKEALARVGRSEDLRLMRAAAASLEKIDEQYAREVLTETLTQDANPVVRANALEIILTKKDPVFIDALIDALEKDESAAVREKAARALGRLRDVRAAEAIGAVVQVEQDERVRKACLNALDNIGRRELRNRYWPPMKSITVDLESDVPRKRLEAVDALRWKESEPGVVNALLQATQDDDGNVRSRAFEALGRRKDKEAIEPLIKSLENECETYRNPAAKALSAMGSVAVQDLVPLLKHTSACMRRRAAAALGAIKDIRAVKYLVKSLDDKDPEVRVAAARALGSIWTGEAVAQDRSMTDTYIIPMLSHRSARMRRTAVEALGKSNDAQFVDSLIVLLGDKEPEVRWSAARALGQIGDSRAVDALSRLTDDSDIGIRRRAQTSLQEIRMAAQ